MGVAYYANYLRWFEIGRTEFMREAGFPYEQAEREGIFFPVTEVQCRYRRPALYDNLLRIETTVESLSRGSAEVQLSDRAGRGTASRWRQAGPSTPASTATAR